MGFFSTYLFGGLPYAAPLAIDSVTPETGLSVGGEDFVVCGDSLNPLDWDDTFTAGILDVTKFTDTSSGSGSVTTGSPNLVLSTSATSGSTASILTVQSWVDTQAETIITLPRITAYPTSEVALFELTLRVDASNYATIGVYLGTTLESLVLRTSVLVGGVQVASKGEVWSVGGTTLKILRWDSGVYFIANGVVFHTVENFVATAATFELASANVAASYSVETQVSAFTYKPFVVFGNQPVPSTVAVSQKRLRGKVPHSVSAKSELGAFAGSVDVSVVGNGTITAVDAYTYTYKDGLVIIKNGADNVKMSLISDDMLVTPSGVIRGLGENR